MSIWISRLDVRGFQRLSGEFSFGRGLNIIQGENEAGKSTLHDLLLRVLFGFSAAEQRKALGVSRKDKSAPWVGDKYGVLARVAEVGSDVERYIIDWKFDAHTFLVTDAVTGAPERDFASDRSPGERLLGIASGDFEQICCLNQADILAVGSSETLMAALQSAVASTGAGRVAVEGADARLVGVLRGIGARVDTYNPTPAGTWAKLREERSEIEAALVVCRAGREELVGLAQLAGEAQAASTTAQARVLALQQAQLTDELAALTERLQTALSLGATASTAPAGPGAVSAETAGRIEGIRQQLAEVSAEVAGLERAAQESAASVKEAAQLERDARRRAADLSLYEAVDLSAEAVVRDVEPSLRAADQASREPSPESPERDARIAKFRAERLRLVQAAVPPRRPALLLVILTFGLALVLYQRKLRGHEGRVAELLAEFGGRSFDELDSRLLAEDRAMTAWDALVQAHRSRSLAAEEALAGLRADLVAALDGAAVPASVDVMARATGYLQQCQRRRELDQAKFDHSRAERQLAELEGPRRDLDRRREERESWRMKLNGEFAALGIDVTDADAADLAYETVIAETAVADAALKTANAARYQLSGALGQETLAGLEDRVRTAQEKLGDHARRHGDLSADGPSDRADIPRQLAEGQEAASTSQDVAVRLDTELLQKESNLAFPAELEESLDAIDLRLARAEMIKDAVRIAREELVAAASETYRAFAPHLNARLAETLPRITRGRYTEALVDDKLAITVLSAEAGRHISVEQLSRGTRDQVFLVQRLEIARLLHGTVAKAPLLLDDPFAHFDLRRQRLALEILGEIGETRQVFLFTEDDRVVELARSVVPTLTVTELPSP